MKRILVDIGRVGDNLYAHAPLLLGCVSVGSTLEEVKRNFTEAITLHVEGCTESGESDLLPEEVKGEYGLAYRVSAEVRLNIRCHNTTLYNYEPQSYKRRKKTDEDSQHDDLS
jgi:predicted RNase H-like HicB family nuclease